MHFIHWCTWKSSQFYIIISMMTSFMRMSQKLVFHQSKCICAIKRILSTTAMYVSSSSFMYLRISCYCYACLNSSDLRVGVTTLLNTIQYNHWGCKKGSTQKHIQTTLGFDIVQNGEKSFVYEANHSKLRSTLQRWGSHVQLSDA